jgi:hypothetical protein
VARQDHDRSRSANIALGARPQAEDFVLSAAPRGLDLGDVDLLHVHHRVERALCLVATGAIASVSTRGVICQETPHLSLHQPHALSWPPLPTMAFQ